MFYYQVNIHDAAFDCSSERLGIIANVSDDASNAVVVLMYNTVTKEWSNMPFWIEDTENGMYR